MSASGPLSCLELAQVDARPSTSAPPRVRSSLGERGTLVAGQQLVDRHVVEPGQALQAGHRDGPLATLVGAEHRRLELLVARWPRPPGATGASGGGWRAAARPPCGCSWRASPVLAVARRDRRPPVVCGPLPACSTPVRAGRGDPATRRPGQAATIRGGHRVRRVVAGGSAVHARCRPTVSAARYRAPRGPPAARSAPPPAAMRRRLGPQHVGRRARPSWRTGPAPRRPSHPPGPMSTVGRAERGRRPAAVGGHRAGQPSAVGEARRAAPPRAAGCAGTAWPPPGPPVRQRGRPAGPARSSSQRTTERVRDERHDAVDAQLGELLHDQLGPLALDQREGDRERPVRARARSPDRATGSSSSPEAARPPPAGAVGHRHGVAVAQRAAPGRGGGGRRRRAPARSRSSTNTCGPAPIAGGSGTAGGLGARRPALLERRADAGEEALVGRGDSSPRSSASWRSSSSCSSVRSAGVSTTTAPQVAPAAAARRAARPAPAGGTPARSGCPWSTTSSSAPSRVSKSSVQPSAAWANGDVQRGARGRRRGARSGRGAGPARGRRGRRRRRPAGRPRPGR